MPPAGRSRRGAGGLRLAQRRVLVHGHGAAREPAGPGALRGGGPFPGGRPRRPAALPAVGGRRAAARGRPVQRVTFGATPDSHLAQAAREEDAIVEAAPQRRAGTPWPGCWTPGASSPPSRPSYRNGPGWPAWPPAPCSAARRRRERRRCHCAPRTPPPALRPAARRRQSRCASRRASWPAWPWAPCPRRGSWTASTPRRGAGTPPPGAPLPSPAPPHVLARPLLIPPPAVEGRGRKPRAKEGTMSGAKTTYGVGVAGLDHWYAGIGAVDDLRQSSASEGGSRRPPGRGAAAPLRGRAGDPRGHHRLPRHRRPGRRGYPGHRLHHGGERRPLPGRRAAG